MVFLLQHTQNRDTCFIQIKLDELGPAPARVARFWGSNS